MEKRRYFLIWHFVRYTIRRKIIIEDNRNQFCRFSINLFRWQQIICLLFFRWHMHTLYSRRMSQIYLQLPAKDIVKIKTNANEETKHTTHLMSQTDGETTETICFSPRKWHKKYQQKNIVSHFNGCHFIFDGTIFVCIFIELYFFYVDGWPSLAIAP